MSEQDIQKSILDYLNFHGVAVKTGSGAVLEGFDFIGIDREADYLEIARARIDYWSKQKEEPEPSLFTIESESK